MSNQRMTTSEVLAALALERTRLLSRKQLIQA